MAAVEKWKGTTYGNSWMHRSLTAMLRVCDVRVFYCFTAVFVVPVCLLLGSLRRHTYRYFRERWRMSRWRASWMTYRNFCLFSQVVIDKFAMYAGKRFHVDTTGYEHFLRLADRKEGFVQLSAHIGNYEIAGYTLCAEKKRFNALVFAGEKASVMQGRTQLFADTNIRMIPVTADMSHLFTVNSALADGETVSMPADRLIGSKKQVGVTFLGAEAMFPQGPFAVSVMRGLDVLAVNVMKTGTKRYHIYVTPLEYDRQATRSQQIQQLASGYVQELERMLSMHPEQWYNYFNFWS